MPQRSLRAQRQRLSYAVLCLVFGVGLIIYGSGKAYDVIAPGPLSSPHAERLAHHGNDRCASCHPQAHQSLGQWVGGLFGTASNAKPVTQTDLCLKCHQRDLCHEYALVAHNVAPSALAELTAAKLNPQATNVGGAVIHQVSGQNVFGSTFRNGQPIACATCHREHHGQEIDMKAMTDQQCQSCHGQNFHSFELDHPEFKSWPRVTIQGIRFDHSTHHFKHFPHGNRPFECAQCHRDDRQGNVQQLVGFDQACGSCHQGKLELSAERGFALLQLPSLDVEALRSSQQDIGQWPAKLSQDFDGRLSPLCELLLRADRDAGAGLDVLGPGFDFLDLDSTDRAQTVAAGQVAWGIKRLVADLTLRGNDAIRQLMQIVLELPIDDERLARLSQNFSPTLVRDSAGLWFPQLWQEVTPEQVMPISSIGVELQANSAMREPDSRRLILPNDILARLLQSEGVAQDERQEMLADNPLQGVYGSATESAKPNQSQQATGPTNVPGPVSPSAMVPATSAATADSQRSEKKNSDLPSQNAAIGLETPSVDDPNLLARNPLAGYGNGTSQLSMPALEAPRDNRLSSNDDVASQSATGRQTTETPGRMSNQNAPAQEPSVPVSPIPTPSGAGQSKVVGWIRDDGDYSLKYHLQGHADLWMKEWIDVLIERQSKGNPQTWLTFAIGEIAAPDKAGNCLLCHGDRVRPDLTASVNWTSKYRDPALKGWTKFNHRPHTLLPGLSDCRSCHQLRETPAGQGGSSPAVANRETQTAGNVHLAGFSKMAGNSADLVGFTGLNDGVGHRSDFHSLTKTQCAACHQSGSTRSSCSTCHNYHVGQRVQK
ncbi:MAG: hypothetical protein Q8M16_07905 [Pirellulaceae bacterium]|nr:hypothetical protein [Pirellulaceae bacterium]